VVPSTSARSLVLATDLYKNTVVLLFLVRYLRLGTRRLIISHNEVWPTSKLYCYFLQGHVTSVVKQVSFFSFYMLYRLLRMYMLYMLLRMGELIKQEAFLIHMVRMTTAIL
jgi:hypothetical protein